MASVREFILRPVAQCWFMQRPLQGWMNAGSGTSVRWGWMVSPPVLCTQQGDSESLPRSPRLWSVKCIKHLFIKWKNMCDAVHMLYKRDPGGKHLWIQLYLELYLALALTESLFSLIPLRRRYIICIGDSVFVVWLVSTHFPKSKIHSELRMHLTFTSWQHAKSDFKHQCIWCISRDSGAER